MVKVFKLEDLDCANCARKMEDAIKKIPGVEDASVQFLTQKLTLTAPEEQFPALLKQVDRACRRIEPDCRVLYK